MCEGGDPNGATKIVLAGDSHVGQWWPAVNKAAVDNHWKLYIVGKNGCALADVEISVGETADPWPDCSAWQRHATAAILALHPDLIIYANHAQGYAEKVSLRDNFADLWSAGVTRTLAQFTGSSEVLYLGQSPLLASDPGACLSDNLSNVAKCSTPIDEAVHPAILQLGASLARQNDALFFDVSSMLCTDLCPMMDHNIVMYHDVGHLSQTYSLALAGNMAAVIKTALSCGDVSPVVTCRVP